MTKSESWITVKNNLKINYSVFLLYVLIHIGFVLSLILIIYFTMGFGKTTFTTKHLTIVRDYNLNILIIQVISWIFGFTFGDWFINKFTQEFLVYTESEQQMDIFSKQRKTVYPKRHPVDVKNQIIKYFKTKFHTKKKIIKKILAIVVILIIIEPVDLFASISIADTMLKTNPNYLSSSPTFFISSFFVIYILSDYFFLHEVVPTLREKTRIAFFPKIIYFTLLFVISCSVVLFSIIHYGIF